VNRALPLAVALVVALAPAAARPSAADAFENKVKPVSGQLYTKAGKLELTLPSARVSLNDAFFTKYMAGAKLGYHFAEWLSLGVGGAIGTSRPTGSTNVCPLGRGCREATDPELFQVPGLIKWTAMAELAFSPVYGKLNVFAEKAVHFDLSLFGGGGLVAYRDVLSGDQLVATPGLTPGTATSPAFHAGVGARIFLARWVALRLELPVTFYRVSSLRTGNWQMQFFADAGLSFFLPVGSRDER
jgi:outer membrane beta-barrel protein